jgi:sporulation protein YlmC with PRC-barrel domain
MGMRHKKCHEPSRATCLTFGSQTRVVLRGSVNNELNGFRSEQRLLERPLCNQQIFHLRDHLGSSGLKPLWKAASFYAVRDCPGRPGSVYVSPSISGIHSIAVSPVNEQLGFFRVKHEALIDVLIPWSCVVAVSQPILIRPSRVPSRRSISAETPGPRLRKDR